MFKSCASFIVGVLLLWCCGNAASVEFDCVTLPLNPEEPPADCPALEWCNCLKSELSSLEGGAPTTIVQAHVYVVGQAVPRALVLEADTGTLDIDLLEPGDVIGRFVVDVEVGQPQPFFLDFAMTVTAVDADEGIADFEVRLQETNEVTKQVFEYDPLDAGHSEGLLYTGTVGGFGEDNGFELRYELAELALGASSLAITEGDLTAPTFNSPVLLRFFDPAEFSPPEDVFVAPARGGILTLRTVLVQFTDPVFGEKETVEEFTIEGTGTGPRFIRGDCDGSGSTGGVNDALTLLTSNFLGGVTIGCPAACDADGNGSLTGVADALHMLTVNFLGNATIPEPFPDCGEGTRDSDAVLGCPEPPEVCQQ